MSGADADRLEVQQLAACSDGGLMPDPPNGCACCVCPALTLFWNASLYDVKTFEEWKTNLMSLAILFNFLCAQHVSDINISIISSLRLCCWVTTSVVLFSVRCVLEIWRGWFLVVFVLQASACNTNKICFTISLFHASTCFKHHVITIIGSRPVHRTATYRCDDTRGCIIQFWPPDDEHMVVETCRGMK